MPLPPSRRSSSLQLRQQRRAGSRKSSIGKAIALVVVLAILIADRRTERDVAVDRLASDARRGRACAAADRRAPLTSCALRRHQLRVLAAARIDAERLAAEHRRDLVGVEARGVHDRARQDASRPACAARCRPAATSAPIERRSRAAGDVALRRRAAPACARAPRLRGCRCCGENSAAFARDVRLARADERGVDHPQTFDAVGLAARRGASRAPRPRCRRARRSAFRSGGAGRRARRRTRRASARRSTQCLAFSVPAG